MFTAIARAELHSYRQLPQRWYQIGLKFRDEPRPRGGLLRVREFQMKDAYSFDLDTAGLEVAYAEMRAAYERIYARCQVQALPAEAYSGAMGGRESIEFVVRTPAGEDEVIHCPACGYTANSEVARSIVAAHLDSASDLDEPEMFPTPRVLTIDALAAPPYAIPPERQLKTLIYVADGQPVVAVLRGDHTLNEIKLQHEVRASGVRPAEPDEVFALMGAHPGSLGAVAFNGASVVVDAALVGRTGMATGANRDGFHLRGVDVDRDILNGPTARAADLRLARAADACATCGEALESFAALEVGHIFKLGTRYAVQLGATVLDVDGRETPLVMGSYGIGLGRLLAAVVEQHHDSDGIVWPPAVAPFAVTVLALGLEPELLQFADEVVGQVQAAGLDVLYDDRPERPGLKFKDADLIGIPLRIAVGRRGLADRTVEWKLRTRQAIDVVALTDLTARAEAWLRGQTGRD